MNYSPLLLASLIALTSPLTSIQIPVETTAIDIDASQPFLAPYLKDLEELGYCVIPEVLTTSEAEQLYTRVWCEFIEKAWPNCKMDDRSNWKETFPMHNRVGIFAGPAGQTQVMWDLRQDPRIVDIFAKVWNTQDLIVSMDGLSFMCPPEIRKGNTVPFPHVDQAVLHRQDNFTHNNNPSNDFVSESLLKTHPYTIQGQFLFEDSCEGDGGFYCIPKSHLRFTEFAPQLEAINSQEMPKEERREIRVSYIDTFFDLNNLESTYCRKHVTAPRGSLILWDSRTIHWNQHADEHRPLQNNPRVRMVGYLCYVPKARLTEEGRMHRKEAFENGVSTGHNAAYPELKYTKNHIHADLKQYLESPDYIQPEIMLTPLGEALLGLATTKNNDVSYSDADKPEFPYAAYSFQEVKMDALTFKNIAEEYAYRIWNNQDLSAIQEFLDPEIVIHSLLGDYHGHEAMKNVVDAWLKAFPDLKVTNMTTTRENDRVVIQWKAKGTHQGEFKNIPPTQKSISYKGVTIYKLSNHKITEYWAYLDMQHLLNQIR